MVSALMLLRCKSTVPCFRMLFNHWNDTGNKTWNWQYGFKLLQTLPTPLPTAVDIGHTTKCNVTPRCWSCCRCWLLQSISALRGTDAGISMLPGHDPLASHMSPCRARSRLFMQYFYTLYVRLNTVMFVHYSLDKYIRVHDRDIVFHTSSKTTATIFEKKTTTASFWRCHRMIFRHPQNSWI